MYKDSCDFVVFFYIYYARLKNTGPPVRREKRKDGLPLAATAVPVHMQQTCVLRWRSLRLGCAHGQRGNGEGYVQQNFSECNYSDEGRR